MANDCFVRCVRCNRNALLIAKPEDSEKTLFELKADRGWFWFEDYKGHLCDDCQLAIGVKGIINHKKPVSHCTKRDFEKLKGLFSPYEVLEFKDD